MAATDCTVLVGEWCDPTWGVWVDMYMTFVEQKSQAADRRHTMQGAQRPWQVVGLIREVLARLWGDHSGQVLGKLIVAPHKGYRAWHGMAWASCHLAVTSCKTARSRLVTHA